MLFAILSILSIGICSSKIYFSDTFDKGSLEKWEYSEVSNITHGIFGIATKRGGEPEDMAIKTLNDSSYYHMSAKLDETFNTETHDLYVQYGVTYEQDIDCGGGYIKLYPKIDQKALVEPTPYHIMLGPDICGYSTRKCHLILHHKGTNYQITNEISFAMDKKPHFIQLFIGKDKNFSVHIDGKSSASGKLEDSFKYLKPKTIDDPNDKKPEDWVEEEMIADPNDVKPSTWDERKTIADPKATKPENWDDETDGEWEADSIPNPEYKGEWAPKSIPNPKYKGVWKAKQIENPDYVADESFANYPIDYIGFDLWQVRSGTVFDSFLITDDAKEAKEHEEMVLAKIKEQMKKIEVEDEATRKKAAEEAAKRKEEDPDSKKDEDGEPEEDEDEASETDPEMDHEPEHEPGPDEHADL